MATAYINIGSNIGDRMAHLERAVAAVEAEFAAPARRSPVVESEPWGYESRSRFLNIGLALEVSAGPEAIMRRLLEVQGRVDPTPHRDAGGGYVDRAVDIDLIAVDDLTVSGDFLTLPHPRMHERLFVLEPMAFLAPEWRHPVLGLTVNELLKRVAIGQ